eukprot:TRINITY_DN17023_c0_g1_i1.p1 TRINITY_DN17023_c0_g1~~TRINITY_DN17023_c0_g1_i1.p1  ORF type:complete len:235 (-),score=63.44 TRINITY_DN17023_c0_g1_i1:52-735(-)
MQKAGKQEVKKEMKEGKEKKTGKEKTQEVDKSEQTTEEEEESEEENEEGTRQRKGGDSGDTISSLYGPQSATSVLLLGSFFALGMSVALQYLLLYGSSWRPESALVWGLAFQSFACTGVLFYVQSVEGSSQFLSKFLGCFTLLLCGIGTMLVLHSAIYATQQFLCTDLDVVEGSAFVEEICGLSSQYHEAVGYHQPVHVRSGWDHPLTPLEQLELKVEKWKQQQHRG